MSKTATSVSTIIVCEPGKKPRVESITATANMYELLRKLVAGYLEYISYPRHLNRGGLAVIVDENGMQKGSLYNRWGLLGTFLVVRQSRNWNHPGIMTKEMINDVILDLANDYGYMDPRSGVLNQFQQRIGFFTEGAVRADEFKQQGGDWEPQLHFTGQHKLPEIIFLNWLLQRYVRGIVAFFICEPMPGMYSIELQFGESDDAQRQLQECRTLYIDAFDGNGVLKPERGLWPPASS